MMHNCKKCSSSHQPTPGWPHEGGRAAKNSTAMGRSPPNSGGQRQAPPARPQPPGGRPDDDHHDDADDDDDMEPHLAGKSLQHFYSVKRPRGNP